MYDFDDVAGDYDPVDECTCKCDYCHAGRHNHCTSYAMCTAPVDDEDEPEEPSEEEDVQRCDGSGVIEEAWDGGPYFYVIQECPGCSACRVPEVVIVPRDDQTADVEF